MARFARICLLVALPTLVTLAFLPNADAQKKPKPYRLPPVDLKQQVIWGATCDGPDGTGLAFGGEDQKADDGRPHTRIKVNGVWKDIHEELRKKNRLQTYCDRYGELVEQQKHLISKLRALLLQGLPAKEMQQRVNAEIIPLFDQEGKGIKQLEKQIEAVRTQDRARAGDGDPHENSRAGRSLVDIKCALVENGEARSLLMRLLNGKDVRKWWPSEIVGQAWLAYVDLQGAASACAPEPPPRALSPIVYDKKTKVYVLFGGDHLDYLSNDVWTFNPADNKWTQRYTSKSPPARAGHSLKAPGDGKITMSGGYTYTSATGYCSAQYQEIDDGQWTYDIAANTWTGTAMPPDGNPPVFRFGPFHPKFFLQDPKPDAAAFQKQLTNLPANTWVSTKPPHLPQLNRDWGTAVLDPDRDVILRFSGGHSAHGGSDVLHYHLASNRWELPFPVEFPLGQLYSNTSYPEGFNFNRRPWVTGHTYQNYGYDPVFKKMLFTGQTKDCFIYDPEVADWTGRFAKPKGMVYNSCFYTLTLCPTPQGLVCWTAQGGVFQFDAGKKEWVEIKLNGEKLPGSVVDNSTVVHDSKRDRLLFFRKGYGEKNRYDGKIHALDRKTGAVSTLSPKGMAAAAAVPYLCQIRYDPNNDLLLVGGTLPPGEDGVRRTPAYDCAANSWVTLKLTGDDPSGKRGRNVSLGMMYDAKRKLFWAVDTRSNIFVLRLDPKSADARPLR